MEKGLIRFIDLFAGIGGIRCGLEQAAHDMGIATRCVFTSEIKPSAIEVLRQNHPDEKICGDITQIPATEIPDFDILCAGFPCQAFSAAGKRLGFTDTRGTLFFDVERILRAKRPAGFILENVEGLVNHDKGNTFATIVSHLEDIGYKVTYKILDSADFGVPQERRRIYITGTFTGKVNLDGFPATRKSVGDVLQHGLPTAHTPFTDKLISIYGIDALRGKSIKDKRGGDANIHSWDLEMKGPLSQEQKNLLNLMLKERRKKKWAAQHGIDWMDGMPLTIAQIRTFCNHGNLEWMLRDMEAKGYVRYEHPKRLVRTMTDRGLSSHREQDTTKEKGYNIVTGKMSFEVNKILDPDGLAPTLVAMDMQRIYVVDGSGLRKLTMREGLRMFGYPESLKFNIPDKDGYDLLGNTVVVPVVKAVAGRLIETINNHIYGCSRESIQSTGK